MAGTVGVADVAIVLGALVGVVDEERNRRPRGDGTAGAVILEHTGEDLDEVVLAPLRHEARLAGLAPVEEGLDELGRQGQPRRATIDDDAQRRTVAFAPCGDAEEMSKGVV